MIPSGGLITIYALFSRGEALCSTCMEDEAEGVEYESYGSISSTSTEERDGHTVKEAYEPHSQLQITEELIKQTQQELCLIKLCWPEVDLTNDRYLKTLPSSYCTLSDKEKLLAWYAENFRQQFSVKYPDRKPLLLVCENECGVQKFVSTTIRRSTLPYMELYTWQGCGKFVSDYIEYEPLDKALSMPKHLRSPTWLVQVQKGNCFECATFLLSLLLGHGYNAFVVSGYASKEQTLCDLTRIPSPYLSKPEEPTQSVDAAKPVITKYKLNPPKEYISLFLSELEEEKARKLQKKLDQDEKEQQKLIEELEQLPVDEYRGHRIHAWVVILPEYGSLRQDEISSPLFIEPSTGMAYDATDDDTAQLYLGVESIWNDKNYWVNMLSTESPANIIWDLTKVELWEHLLPGEPWTMRGVGEDLDEDTAVQQEKHLDMPFSYVNEIKISEQDYEQRYPNGTKTIFYKKTKVEFFAPYLQHDGMIRRITVYDDYDYMSRVEGYEYYTHRGDHLIELRQNFNDDSVIDYYERGRADHCKEHRYFANCPNRADSERILDFYHTARFDCLSRIEMHPNYLTQHFIDRDDFLYYRFNRLENRHVQFSKDKRGDVMQDIHSRQISKITEKFHRDERIRATKNIAIREFCMSENEIHLTYHYNVGQYTRATRMYVKPPLAERGDRLVVSPAMTRGYTPLDETEKGLELLYELDTQLKEEDISVSQIRGAEEEVLYFLQNRDKEYLMPNLTISIYDKFRESDATGDSEWSQRESQKDASGEVDYLKPYLARMGDPQTVSMANAKLLQEECLNDYKQSLVRRANKILRSFDKCLQELAKMQDLLTQDDSLPREEEEKILEKMNEINFTMQTLETRLNRHRDLVPKLYKKLYDNLQQHPIIVAHAITPNDLSQT